MAESTKEGVVHGAEYDADVSAPDDQISGLRMSDREKRRDSLVEVFGVCVRVWETGALVNGVDQMRTIGPIAARLRIARNSDDGLAFLLRQNFWAWGMNSGRLWDIARVFLRIRLGAGHREDNRDQHRFGVDCNDPSILIWTSEAKHITPVLGRLKGGERCRVTGMLCI